MTSINVAFAQETERQDSIYGLEVSIIYIYGRMNISFYSTYNKDEIKNITADFYRTGDDDWKKSFLVYKYDNEHFNNPIYLGTVTIEDIDSNVYKVNINEIDINILGIRPGEPLKIRLYLNGDHLQSSSTWQSNMLTFFFDPLSTSLNKIINDKGNYTYKYYLLSGKESKEVPVGIPFIQMTYKNNIFVASEKYLSK
jgi:hypothetical protein